MHIGLKFLVFVVVSVILLCGIPAAYYMIVMANASFPVPEKIAGIPKSAIWIGGADGGGEGMTSNRREPINSPLRSTKVARTGRYSMACTCIMAA